MAGYSIDIVAVGPPPADPYDPAAPAWALAAGLAGRGHDVRVVHPSGEAGRPPPDAVATATFPPISRHLGTAEGDAELARAARHQLRPRVDVLIRDPLRAGALGLGGAPRARIAFVRSLDSAPSTPSTEGGAIARLRSRLGGGGVTRRLERAALLEATAIACESPELADQLPALFRLAAPVVRTLTRPVWLPSSLPSRASARAAVGVPLDDPLVAWVAPPERADAAAVALARESFQRLRPIFAGAHLLLVGADAVAANGVAARPSRDLETVVNAIAAADVVVLPGTRRTFDPGIAIAHRTATVPIVGPATRVGDGEEGTVRRLETGDASELASALAELLADPSRRRALLDGAADRARPYEPSAVAAELERLGWLGAVPTH